MGKNRVLGIDLGGTNIKGALLDLQGRIILDLEVSTEAHKGSMQVIQNMIDLVARLLQEANVTTSQVIGVGIGVPGMPDDSRGKVLFAPNLHWQDVDVRGPMETALGLPIFIDNDANVAALGEAWCGAGMGVTDLVMITIGTGIGSGLIIDGRLYRGVNNSAGEIGHLVMDPQGPLCNCGRRGCLETFASATAILRMAREAIAEGKDTSLRRLQALEAKDVVAAAYQGDPVAVEIINRVSYYLGWAIGNLANTLNPPLVLLGGGVAKAGELLFGQVRQRITEFALELPANALMVKSAALGNKAGSVGAAALVLEAISQCNKD